MYIHMLTPRPNLLSEQTHSTYNNNNNEGNDASNISTPQKTWT